MKLLKFRIFASSLLCLFVFGQNQLHSQGTAINTTGSSADASAILDVSSSDKGVHLYPV